MRIAISTVMDAAKSGAWQVTRNVIAQMKVLDRENEYVIFVEKTYRDEFGAFPANFKLVRVNVTAEQPIRNILWHSFVLPFLLMKHHIDVLHLPWHSAALLMKTRPVVLSIYDLTEYRLPAHYSKSRMLYRKLMLPVNSRLADRIIAISDHTKADIKQYLGIPDGKIARIYIACSDIFKPMDSGQAGAYVKEKYGLRLPFILYVGQIQHPNKNLYRLLDAFKILKTREHIPHGLVLVGKPHASAGTIVRHVADLDLKDAVTFTGYLEDEVLPHFYNAADVFAYPSLFEGFGIPPLEAMSCGTPVVSSNSSALPEVIGKAGILVNPFDVEALAEAVLKVISDADVRAQLRQSGLEQASKFSWAKSALEMRKLYENMQT